MRFRPLALFALVAGLAATLGEMPTTDAQEKVGKKNKKRIVPPADPAKPGDPAAKPADKPAAKPVAVIPTPDAKDAAALAKVIDAEIGRKLADAKITPSARSTDEEFLRRAYLDITGVIPTADKAGAFLDDKSADKRAKLIDELLADPNFGRQHGRHLGRPSCSRRTSDNRFVLTRRRSTSGSKRSSTRTPGWDKFVTEPRHRDRHRGGEPGGHLLPRQPRRGQADRHRRPSTSSASSSSAPSATTTRSPTGSRPSTGAWPRSSAR